MVSLEYISQEDAQNLLDSGITLEEYQVYLSKKRSMEVRLVVVSVDNAWNKPVTNLDIFRDEDNDES